MNYELLIAHIADLHYYPAALAGGFNRAFADDNDHLGKPARHSERLLRATLEQLRQEPVQFALIAGDLTHEGEYDAHVALAELLREFQRQTGTQMLLVPGNHDINNDHAAEYTSGKKQPARQTSIEDFWVIYRPLLPEGARFCGSDYALELDERHTLIALDTTKPDARVHGEITAEQLHWALEECARASEAGRTVLGLMHHNLASHMGHILSGYLLDNYLHVRERLARAGMKFCFCGHQHRGHVAKINCDDHVLYDVCAPALNSFPCQFHRVALQDNNAQVTAHAADPTLPLHDSFKFTFAGRRGGLMGFFSANLQRKLPEVLEDIAQCGGAQSWLTQRGTQTPAWLRPVLAQLDARYIAKPANALKLAEKVLRRVMKLRISPHGTLQDCFETSLVFVYGFGDWRQDPLLRDAVQRIEDGRFVSQALRLAGEIIARDMLRTGRQSRLLLQVSLAAVFLPHRRAISRALAKLSLDMLSMPRKQEYNLKG
ncbi:MAG: metallophosphoesterase [Oscillospiraceae bacterium]|nr:metallophosphoesterase [Oscillospiraceae bacterium]